MPFSPNSNTFQPFNSLNYFSGLLERVLLREIRFLPEGDCCGRISCRSQPFLVFQLVLSLSLWLVCFLFDIDHINIIRVFFFRFFLRCLSRLSVSWRHFAQRWSFSVACCYLSYFLPICLFYCPVVCIRWRSDPFSCSCCIIISSYLYCCVFFGNIK